MTPGQERALSELKRLHAADPDNFDIIGQVELIEQRLVAHISLRLGPVETAEGGLDLHEREEFILRVPPNFPFDYPSLSVDHTRFAGFPHVVWSKSICLYRSAVDWNPRDSLFGFFEKLRQWLWKAAINDMDPLEGPLEPPHHITDFSQRLFVVRANAPASPGQPWIGIAHLDPFPNRIDLVGWTDWSEPWPEQGSIAVAVMLCDPLPMEFPRNGREFFAELAKQRVDRKRLLALLAFASKLTADDVPIHLVVGLPMRRSFDGEARQHIAVWTTDPSLTKGLRLTMAEEDDTNKLREMRDDLADTLCMLLETGEISWCRILEDRPEIVTRRDEETSVAWFSRKNVLILGCGALGSWIAESVARAGASSIHLVDNGIVKPGLLIRQNFRLDDIGAPKAKALAARLQSITPSITVEHEATDAHHFIVSNPSRFRSFDVVIDCTASSIVQMKLERDWSIFRRDTPPLISIGIDASASRCIAITVPTNSAGGLWDAYLQLKTRLCVPGRNDEIVHSFYSDHARHRLFQPEPGCSDPTFHGSTADVCALAATALNLTTQYLVLAQNPVGIAFQSHVFNVSNAEVQVFPLSCLKEMQVGTYRIRLTPNVFAEARACVRQNNRLRSPEHETGGLLWGLWDDTVQIIWVFDASGPPPDSQHDPGHFVCGTQGTHDEHARRITLSHGACAFVGLWHTHPEMPSQQSTVDIAGMTTLVSAVGQNLRRSLLAIFGREAGEPSVAFFVYESQLREAAYELLTVGTGHAILEDPVV
jgi:hypothetical protein